MANIPAATSKLAAVNILLASIGEAPVNQLGSGYERADMAENTIEEVMRSTQLMGWNWNTEDNFKLQVNSDSEIVVPTNTLRIDSQTKMYVLRGTRLYNKLKHTYRFTSDVLVTLIVFLQFDELPEIARQYITYRAGRVFQGRVVGSQIIHQFTEKEELAALASLRDEELEAGNYSIFHNQELINMLDRSTSTPIYDRPAGLIDGAIIDV